MNRLGMCAVLALGASFLSPASTGQVGAEPVLDAWVMPAYTLPRDAKMIAGERPVPVEPASDRILVEPDPLRALGMTCTDRITHLLEGEAVPSGPFTVELWMMEHVNMPVSAMLAARAADASQSPVWSIGYHDGKIAMIFGDEPDDRLIVEARPLSFKEYWWHVVGTFDGQNATLFVNGEVVARATIALELRPSGAMAQLELAGFTENEPYMKVNDLVHHVRVHDSVVSDGDIAARFGELSGAIEQGILFPGVFHFTAGPYLNASTQESMNILLETDRASTVEISYGLTTPLKERVSLDSPGRLHEVTIDGLEPSTRYFYRVVATDESGETLDTGLLTFKTAVRDDEAFSFALIADTESRPHINNRIANLVWDERPDFMINCGDLTDGGRQPNRWQWTHEYFHGLGSLHTRIPAFPVAGNGEGDLYWYKHYHTLPGNEGFYSFRFGNAEFFMLDSNQSREQFKPGGEQYEWLRRRLENSTATWKFAAHHHPVYTSDENDYGDTFDGQLSPAGDLNVRAIAELYEEYGVDIVMFGHLHTYERSWPIRDGRVDLENGVRYLQVGGGGGHLEDFSPTREWFKSRTRRDNHYCLINVMGNTLQLSVHDLDGAMIDQMEIVKPTERFQASETP